MLLIINRLNLVGVGAYPPAPASIGYLDTSRDGLITPIDVLLVINYLKPSRLARTAMRTEPTNTNEHEMPPTLY